MRILVAIDDDSFGNLIVDFVSGAFSQKGNLIKLLHVIEPSSVSDTITEIYGHGITHKILEERLQKANEMLTALRIDLRSRISKSVPIEVSVLIGSANHVILDAADDWNADVIVMGSHGRMGLSRLCLGSISMSVLAHAGCAVTIVKMPLQGEAESDEAVKTLETMRKYR